MRWIGGILGRSPWGPLYEHLLKVSECADLLVPLAEAFCRGDGEASKSFASRIKRMEREADEIKRDIREHLSRSLFSSLDRADALAVLKEQDPIADRCEDVARYLAARPTIVPEPVAKSLRNLAQDAAATVKKALDVSGELNELADSEPSESDLDLLHDNVREIHDCDATSEARVDELTSMIFSHEDKMKPVDVWLLVQVGEAIGEISDHAENAVESILRLAVGRI